MFIVLICMLQCICVHGYGRGDPLVYTKVGFIGGVKATDGDYDKFLGIPYALIDRNDPFGPSMPNPKFPTTYYANKDGAACPQVLESGPTGSTDCLVLNIYVPTTAPSPLPVLVWIHGGAFKTGSGASQEFGPKFLMKQNVVLVTLNYRLGPYGFMCDGVVGNQGLKDQLKALKWIKENIEAFGGDVNKITLSGESAGSASVDLHYLYNRETLFHQAILQSGTSLCPWVMADPDSTAAGNIASKLGYNTTNPTHAMEILKKLDPIKVVSASEQLGYNFAPCVEGRRPGAFIDIHPINAKPSRNINLIAGTNDDELLYIYAYVDFASLENMFNFRLLTYFNLPNLAALERIVRNFYIGDEAFGNHVKAEIINFDSDLMISYPTERIVNRYVRNGAKVWRYEFSYNGRRNYLKRKYNITFGGASHADEIGYLFDVGALSGEITTEDRLMVDRITTLWTNFVKYGDPTPTTTSLLPVKWVPVTTDRTPHLAMNTQLTIAGRPQTQRMAFWDLFYESHEKTQKGYAENK